MQWVWISSLRLARRFTRLSLPFPLPARIPRTCARSISSSREGKGRGMPIDRPSKKDKSASSTEIVDNYAGDGQDDDGEEALFAQENVRHLSPMEVARMRMAYSLVKEHAEIVQKGLPPVDPETNPMIDPRSFHVRTLPKVPTAALKQFREEVPADEADTARIASTRGVWDAPDPGTDGRPADGDVTETAPADLAVENAWSAVDERTMDPYFYSRMRRQRSHTVNAGYSGPARSGGSGQGVSIGRWGSAGITQSQKRRCRLSDSRGRVRVDFREVNVLGSFLNEHGKIIGRRKSALSAKAQRKVARCVKIARRMALLHPEPKPGLTLRELEEMYLKME